MKILEKIFGTYSEKEIKKLDKTADKIIELSEIYSELSDNELKAKTDEFKNRLNNGETLDDILPEAFAVCSEADYRVLGMRPYRVQILGGIVLHQGRIAELKTGEGKTLVATLPAYLNALSGKGVHIVTVNDYLAKRDSEWMGKVYRFLGLQVGLIIHGLSHAERKAAYAADITYGTNNELGFDYLRDNMEVYENALVQRGHNFAIVDEVDSILIDEARTPLIISGQGDKSTNLYESVNQFVRKLKCKKVSSVDEKEEEADDEDADYIVDEKARTATLTSNGIAKAENAFSIENLADMENTNLSHHINQAIRAYGVMQRDIDYTVKDGQVIIVDEFTGRLMFGRRYNEGLHQAIEAKEGVKIENESKTLATITFQNYFRLYHKISGMTGTAMTEAEEFGTIYKLDIVEIPTNKPVIRKDNPDSVYKTEAGKLRAIAKQVKACNDKGQPVLIGTVSIEKSEQISSILKKNGIKHNVLNAKNHDREAEIVAQAGRYGAVTVATNMAGRGTDIVLGGNAEFLAKEKLRKLGYSDEIIAEAVGYAQTDNEEILETRKLYTTLKREYQLDIDTEADKVRDAGGLYILGTERHESRRIDNQLRGRSGRQGDPGESRFMLSLEDDILRLFGSEHVMSVMEKLGIDEDTPIEQKMLSNTIESAQRQVESRNFQLRKSVIQYDDVMNKQREIIYDQRYRVLRGEDMQDHILNMIKAVSDGIAEHHLMEDKDLKETWIDAITEMKNSGLLNSSLDSIGYPVNLAVDTLPSLLNNLIVKDYKAKEIENTPLLMREMERVIVLRVVDEYWMDHIDAMSELRKGIGLRAYAQTDPVIAYKQEGLEMFEVMVDAIKEETIKRLLKAHVRREGEQKRDKVAKITSESHGGDGTVKKRPVRNTVKIGRNELCPCGSGLKWKKCTCTQYHSS